MAQLRTVAPSGADHSALSVKSLSAGYERVPIIRDISLEVPLGQWLALVGPNGSGKTTLIYSLIGMLTPLSGEVRIAGISLRTEPAAAKSRIGFACAPDRLPDLLTGRQCLDVYAAAKGLREIDPEVRELIEAFELAPALDRFVDTYSLGMRQKLAVLLALLGRPLLIFLDESFNGLDPASSLILKTHLRERITSARSSVILATHSLDVVERYADRAALMLSGEIVREWTASEIAALRSGDGFERALATAATAGMKRGAAQ